MSISGGVGERSGPLCCCQKPSQANHILPADSQANTALGESLRDNERRKALRGLSAHVSVTLRVYTYVYVNMQTCLWDSVL